MVQSILVITLLIYLAVGGYLYIAQRSFIYFPVQSAISNLTEKTFTHNNHQIKTIVLNKGNKKTIIYFGGNAENVEYNVDTFTHIFTEYTVYLVKYRGYGGSSGKPTEQGIYEDARYIYDQISTTHDEISIIGRSLGSGVATYLAAQKKIAKLVLTTPFDSIERIAQSRFPIYPMKIMLKDKYDSASRAANIKAKTLIIAAKEDKTVDISHTKRLVNHLPEGNVTFHILEGVDHVTIISHPRYIDLLKQFM